MKRFVHSAVLVWFGLLCVLFASDFVSALEFSTDPVPIKFTLNSILTLSTDGNISISNLTPGNSVISNGNYIVTVSTNNVAGYMLSATVGCASGDGCYNSNALNDGNGNSFTMVDSTATLTPGKWGVSFDSSATASSSFQALPLYSGTPAVINQTTDAGGTAATGYPGTAETTFRVGAYAADTQVAGTYTNVVNFTAVANIVANCGNYNADYCMQDVGTWGSSLSPNQQIQAMDARDGKLYYVAKLADGNIWMTQNLDHDIVTTQGFYTYANTDIGHGSTPNTNATWTADAATYATNDTTWNRTSHEPESYDPGDLCWDGSFAPSMWEGTLNTNTETCGDDTHYHIGNYYNWTAAVAMNDSSNYNTDHDIANQSICPASWMLPTTSGSTSYENLVAELNLTSGTSGNVQNAPVYFSYSGIWNGSSGGLGVFSSYWRSLVDDSGTSFALYFDVSGLVSPWKSRNRSDGYSVRCIARQKGTSFAFLLYNNIYRYFY